MIDRQLIYKDDARRAILKANPSIVYCIDNIKTVDAVPVRHGHWEWDGKHFYCSECAGTRYHDLVLGLDAAYCPYCGAKLDVEVNEDGK